MQILQVSKLEGFPPFGVGPLPFGIPRRLLPSRLSGVVDQHASEYNTLTKQE